MITNFSRSALAAGLAFQLAAGPVSAAAAIPAIGTAITTGAFRLNHATVRRNATLFEGALVETGAAPARLDLSNGARLELEPESAGQFFGGHLVLDRGATRIGWAAGVATRFQVQARGLTLQPDARAATSRIALIGGGRLEVAVLTGSLLVLNPGGMLVAKIAAGRSLALEPQSKAAGPSRITGRLIAQSGHYLLTDETTNVTLEVSSSALTKPDLTRVLGQRVQVTGSARRGAAPVSGAAQVIEIAQVTPAPPASGSASPGSSGAGGTAPAGAGGAAGGAASGAAVSVTMIAIIGGVAAAAVVGGLAATGSLGGSTAAPVSR